MGQISMEIIRLPGSVLSGNQHLRPTTSHAALMNSSLLRAEIMCGDGNISRKARNQSVRELRWNRSASGKSFALNNTYAVDFTLKRCGFVAMACRVLYDLRRNPAISVLP